MMKHRVSRQGVHTIPINVQLIRDAIDALIDERKELTKALNEILSSHELRSSESNRCQRSQNQVVEMQQRIRMSRKSIKALSRVLFRQVKKLWIKRIRTASRSNANVMDKMLLMIPTPPTGAAANGSLRRGGYEYVFLT